jgi:flagellar hook-length control protein FliK
MEASASAAPSAPPASSASSAAGSAASARARKLAAAAAAAAGAESDTKPGFAELLGRRLDKARADDDSASAALADEPVDTDAALEPGDEITVAVPSDPGSAAWWAQRMRASASAARTGAAAASNELLHAGGRHAAPGASSSLERLAGSDERSARGNPSAKAHSAHAETAFRGAIDAAGERAEDKAAASAGFAQTGDCAQATMAAEAMPKAAELSASLTGGAALTTLMPTDGVAAARTDTPQGTPEPAALPSRDIAPPVASPEFAPALGEVMTLLLSEGTHEARLQLNPQELGPVTVKIELDGAQAHVRFVAGAAEAREALQAAMPLLQQALQESGLSLAGGGVFSRDGSGGSPQDGQNRRGAPKPAADRDGPAAGGAVRQITRGVIDFYA